MNHGSARGNTKTIAGVHIHDPSSNPPVPLYDATVRVRLEFFGRVLDHFVKTGGVLMAMGQLGG
jgi:hypothetical protein